MSDKKKPIDYEFNNLSNEIITEFLLSREIRKPFIILPFFGDGNKVFTLNAKSETSRKAIIRIDNKPFFFKEIPWYCSDEDFLDFSTAFQSFLIKEKLNLPKIITSKGSKKFEEIRGKYYTLHEFILGYNWNSGESEMAYNVGKFVARVHMKSFSFDYYSKSKFSETVWESAKFIVSLLDEDDKRKKLSSLIEESKKKIKNYKNTQCVIHGDCNPSNFIFNSNNEISAIVDFDNTKLDNPVRDLAELLVTFGVVKYKMDSSSFDSIFNKVNVEVVSQILKGYKEESPDVFEQIVPNLLQTMNIIFVELYALAILKNDIPSSSKFEIEKVELQKVKSLIDEGVRTKGLHLVDTFEDCECSDDRLTNYKKLDKLIRNELSVVGLNCVGESYYNFSLGFTAVWLLEESHISIHTWPEKSELSLDIYVCNFTSVNDKKVSKLYDSLKKYFKPKITHLKKLVR